MKSKHFFLNILAVLTVTLPATGQVVLSGTNYTQTFDRLGVGLPAGWSVRTNATATSLGTAVS